MTTIHMTGQRANTAPAAMEFKARERGRLQTAVAMISPTISPANDACHAGRRKTPSRTRTTATGSAATMKESGRLPATGVSNCLNIGHSSPGPWRASPTVPHARESAWRCS